MAEGSKTPAWRLMVDLTTAENVGALLSGLLNFLLV